ncbi:MAG: hypothetical protein AB7U76_26150 [Pirellulales bacterium]
MELVCQQCGKKFDADKRTRKFCSEACFATSREKRETVACVVCGTEFERGGRYVAGQPRRPKGQITCSLECSRRVRYRHGRLCNDLTPLEAAYLAGLWDADGSFIIHGLYRGNSDALSYRAQIAVTKPIIIDWVVATTGIGTRATRNRTNEKHALVYHWQVNGDGAESFTRQLIPYLVLKRPQAELGVEFQERLRDRALKADRTWQEEYRVRMTAMNRRGRQEEIDGN